MKGGTVRTLKGKTNNGPQKGQSFGKSSGPSFSSGFGKKSILSQLKKLEDHDKKDTNKSE